MDNYNYDITLDLKRLLWETRQEPGISLKQIANCIKSELKAEEIEIFIRELKHGNDTKFGEKSTNGKTKNERKRKVASGNSNSSGWRFHG